MILVTGASGSLGRAIAQELAATGLPLALQHHLHPLDDHALPPARATAVALDLADEAATRSALDALRPSAIVHTAAATDVDWCELNPSESRRLNAGATAVLAGWATANGAHLVYTSTDLVFDGVTPPYDEAAPTGPLSHYARTKLEGESAVLDTGGRATVLRVALLYGRGSAHKGTFLDGLVTRLARGESVSLFTDQFRTPAFLGDVAHAVERILALGTTGLFHAGGPERLSRFAFGEAVCRAFGHSSRLIAPASYHAHPFQGSRPPDVSLVSTRLESAVGFDFLRLREGLERVRLGAGPGAA